MDTPAGRFREPEPTKARRDRTAVATRSVARLVVLATAAAVPALACRAASPPQALLTKAPHPLGAPPEDLVLNSGGEMTTVHTGVRVVTLRWKALSRKVVLTRKERETAAGPWAQQVQEVSTPYLVIDVSARCDTELLVAGAFAEGPAVLERWVLEPPASYDARGKYVPIPDRQPPGVLRQVLYSGSEYGHLRAVAIDPEGRFGYVLTEAPRALLRMDFGPPPATPPALTPVIDALELPALGSVTGLFFAEHAVTGRKLVLVASGSGSDARARVEPGLCILLEDPQNCGAFGPPVVVDNELWNARGYGSSSAWTHWGDFSCP